MVITTRTLSVIVIHSFSKWAPIVYITTNTWCHIVLHDWFINTQQPTMNTTTNSIPNSEMNNIDEIQDFTSGPSSQDVVSDQSWMFKQKLITSSVGNCTNPRKYQWNGPNSQRFVGIVTKCLYTKLKCEPLPLVMRECLMCSNCVII